MITNHDIEIAFVRAQNRINEEIDVAQYQFMLPDLEQMADDFLKMRKRKGPEQVNISNPIANEEI